jgi:hypothetical protein
MADLQAWLAERAKQDQRLYEQYGKSLEKDHTGEYVAIGADGQTLIGASAAEVLQQAVDAFGSGNFALKRVGHRTFGRWLAVCG